MISHSYKRWTIVVWSGNNYENKASTIITYKYALKIFVSSHPDNRIIQKLWNEIIKIHNNSTDKIKQGWLKSATPWWNLGTGN